MVLPPIPKWVRPRPAIYDVAEPVAPIQGKPVVRHDLMPGDCLKAYRERVAAKKEQS